MSLGESKGGLPPDSVVEDEDAILKDSQRLIETYHDPNPGSMTQIVLAPCSPFSVTGDLMRQSASWHVNMAFSCIRTWPKPKMKKYFARSYLVIDQWRIWQSLDWVGPDVWFAHSVHVNQEEMEVYKHTGCGVAHCPTSNMRLASGIAPIMEMLQMGVKVGLGVDGSASNDGSHLTGRSSPGYAGCPPEIWIRRRISFRTRMRHL